MRFIRFACLLMPLVVHLPQLAQAQGDSNFVAILLKPESFRQIGKNWISASNATGDYQVPNDLKPIKGEGILVNSAIAGKGDHLVTSQEFGDLELEVDIMLSKNSNSGIYLQGRYEIQLFDSWKKTSLSFSDIGGIYSRWTDARQNYEGSAPIMNVAKAPGLWQHLDIKFRAPRFNAKGEKISDARFDEVYLNGVLVQQGSSVTGPTRSSLYEDEKPTGPIMIQGDHGPVAIRNLKVRSAWRSRPAAADDQYSEPGSPYWDAVNSVIVEPASKPSFIKTFLMYGEKKLTHVLSVGNPAQVHYSYDLKQGALFQVWRGQFMDLSMAWIDRGETQLGRPMGSVIVLSDAPVVARLKSESEAWPDSIAFDDMDNKGYTLDKMRTPTFTYTTSGMKVYDNIHVLNTMEGIQRTITCSNAFTDSYCRLITGKTIEKINESLYAINDRSYYLQVDSKSKPMLRQNANGQELLVRLNSSQPVTYSIIW
ncbi:MAG TPA: DUF1080 domain-containing protein [Flavitalea sp.]|nr:DUF1080 domain-containing protein [Flavitalea sp.]